MGTVPLVENFTDARLYAVLALYSVLGYIAWYAFSSRNFKQSSVILMVSVDNVKQKHSKLNGQ